MHYYGKSTGSTMCNCEREGVKVIIVILDLWTFAEMTMQYFCYCGCLSMLNLKELLGVGVVIACVCLCVEGVPLQTLTRCQCVLGWLGKGMGDTVLDFVNISFNLLLCCCRHLSIFLDVSQNQDSVWFCVPYYGESRGWTMCGCWWGWII